MRKHQPTPFPLRMPSELKEWLQLRAEQNLRSMNNEVISLLMEAQKKELTHESAA